MSAVADRDALLRRLRDVTDRARVDGALQPIATQVSEHRDGGIVYALRVVDSLRRKREAEARPAGTNPFLPYDARLHVADLPPRHVLLLNKFPVIEPHALIVTATFEPQSAPLTRDDCAAAAELLRTLGGLVFYNAGTIAGGSQPHRHLQWVPAALDGAQRELPVDAAVRAALAGAAPGEVCVAALPFRHALAALPSLDAGDVHATYRRLLREIGRDPDATVCENYNGLLTPAWLMLVPRVRAEAAGINVNALGFAGALLLRDAMQREALTSAGVANVLGAVTG